METAFLAIIGKYADAYKNGANEMASGAARSARAAEMCTKFKAAKKDHLPWVGKVATLSSTSSGKGVLTVEIADGVTLGTTNNEMSAALGDHSLMEPGTPLFQTAAALHVGQTVLFKGVFKIDRTDCFRVRDLTQEGAMTEPEYEMVFTALQGVP